MYFVLLLLHLVQSRPTTNSSLEDENSSGECCNPSHPSYNAMAKISHYFAYELITEQVEMAGEMDVALSPYSIMSVLQALSLGSRGVTRMEIDAQLMYSSSQNHDLVKCSIQDLKQESNVTVLVASRLFADEPMISSLDPAFTRALKHYYDCDVQGVDFTYDPQTAWQTINKFVENKTQGIVSDFMNRWDATKLMYVNTIVFKGQWKQQFDKDLTHKASFYPSPKNIVNVPMMIAEGVFRSITVSRFRYYGDNLKVVELPYSDEKYNMYIFMAEHGKLELSFMESIISELTIPAFKGHYLQGQDRPLRVSLPKFTISSELDISRALYSLGVRKLFTPDADLSGIFQGYPAYFNKMFHKSVIEVTEEGTTAAGATSSYIVRGGYEKEEFIVNRPFVYVIHDACNNMVLFQGRFYGRQSYT